VILLIPVLLMLLVQQCKSSRKCPRLWKNKVSVFAYYTAQAYSNPSKYRIKHYQQHILQYQYPIKVKEVIILILLTL